MNSLQFFLTITLLACSQIVQPTLAVTATEPSEIIIAQQDNNSPAEDDSDQTTQVDNDGLQTGQTDAEEVSNSSIEEDINSLKEEVKDALEEIDNGPGAVINALEAIDDLEEKALEAIQESDSDAAKEAISAIKESSEAIAAEAIGDEPNIDQQPAQDIGNSNITLLIIAILSSSGIMFYLLYTASPQNSTLQARAEYVSQAFPRVIEGITVYLIVAVVAILSLSATIQPEGTISIISGISGYVLGKQREASQSKIESQEQSAPETND